MKIQSGIRREMWPCISLAAQQRRDRGREEDRSQDRVHEVLKVTMNTTTGSSQNLWGASKEMTFLLKNHPKWPRLWPWRNSAHSCFLIRIKAIQRRRRCHINILSQLLLTTVHLKTSKTFQNQEIAISEQERPTSTMRTQATSSHQLKNQKSSNQPINNLRRSSTWGRIAIRSLFFLKLFFQVRMWINHRRVLPRTTNTHQLSSRWVRCEIEIHILSKWCLKMTRHIGIWDQKRENKSMQMNHLDQV